MVIRLTTQREAVATTPTRTRAASQQRTPMVHHDRVHRDLRISGTMYFSKELRGDPKIETSVKN